ncbi:MAG: DUF981 family protein [Candidatus Bathyarchaeota archaeon]
MVNPLDAVAWTVGANAILIAIAAIKLPYKASTGSVPEEAKSLRLGLAMALGAAGLFLFINGLFIMYGGFLPDYATILFGGVTTLGGLVIVAVSGALYLNVSLKYVSYFAVVMGLFVATNAYAVISYGLTREPLLAGLAYLSAAAPLIASVVAVHTDNKYIRWLFALASLIFAVAWLYEGFEFTMGHLEPSD